VTEPGAVPASKTSWLPAMLVVVVYAVCLATGQWLFGFFWMSRGIPSEGPPWYFIGQDLAGGLVCGAGIGVSLGIAYGSRRSFPDASWMALCFAALWMGYPLGQAVYVIARSSRLWDPDTASTAWSSFEAYTTDPLRHIIFLVCITGSLLLLTRGRRLWR
jgi:hypothetical protein